MTRVDALDKCILDWIGLGVHWKCFKNSCLFELGKHF